MEIERLRYGNEARERERARWARELHDESIQGIGALRLQLANARDLDDAAALRAAVDRALEDLGNEIDGLRHLITELRPAALDDLGLAAALEALARRAQARDGLDVETEIDLGTSTRLDPELESNVYRILQEALTNVGRHAAASQATIRVRVDDGTLEASVRDDGRGIAELEPRDELEGGFGMSGMRERADLVRGELRVAPAPGGGTAVELSVPLAGRPSGLARDSLAPHVGGDLGARGEAELLDSAGAVGLDGPFGDVEALRDLGVREAFGDQVDDRALALAELHHLTCVTAGERGAEPRVDVTTAFHRDREGAQHFRRVGLLQDIAAHARANRLTGVLGVLAHRDHRDRQLRVRDEAARQRTEARAAGHREVQR